MAEDQLYLSRMIKDLKSDMSQLRADMAGLKSGMESVADAMSDMVTASNNTVTKLQTVVDKTAEVVTATSNSSTTLADKLTTVVNTISQGSTVFIKNSTTVIAKHATAISLSVTTKTDHVDVTQDTVNLFNFYATGRVNVYAVGTCTNELSGSSNHGKLHMVLVHNDGTETIAGTANVTAGTSAASYTVNINIDINPGDRLKFRISTNSISASSRTIAVSFAANAIQIRGTIFNNVTQKGVIPV